MTPQDALCELLARLGASKGAAVLISNEELSRWPAAAVRAMKSEKLLVKTRPATSVVCPGCEQECVMPVHTLTRPTRGPSSFIVCDKRSDINRVAVNAERLTQWQCDADVMCGFVAQSLGLRRSGQRAADAGMLNIGTATGIKRSQMLCLKADGELAMFAGANSIPLAELIRYNEGAYSLDSTMIRQLVDSATTTDNRYAPTNARREARKLDTQAMYKSWQMEYRSLKRSHTDMSDVWHAQKIARMDIAKGSSPETIRKHMKR